MKSCPVCGRERVVGDMKCPECGSFYSKIDQIISEHEAQEEMQTFRGRCKRIFESDNVKLELLKELKLLRAESTRGAMFVFFVIFVFVFALIVSVL
jgi:uncharacterized membrane protein YvbJ